MVRGAAQMARLGKELKEAYPDDRLYSRYVYDSSGMAYLIHDGKVHSYGTNSEAYAAARSLLDAYRKG